MLPGRLDLCCSLTLPPPPLSTNQEKIAGDMITVCKELGISEARESCLATFVTRVRENLHVVLCMSPVGDALRVRCRNFPSLINCTTIDWFFPWPEAALISVAERFIESVPLPSDEVPEYDRETLRYREEKRRTVWALSLVILLYFPLFSGKD